MTRDIYNNKCVETVADAIEYFTKDNFTRLNQSKVQNDAEKMAINALYEYDSTIQGKVSTILKEYTSKYEISDVTFFVRDIVLYSGSLSAFRTISYDSDKYLYDEKRKLLVMNVRKCMMFNHTKLFLCCE